MLHLSLIGWALWLPASSAAASSARPQEPRSAEAVFQAAQKDMQAGFYSQAEDGFRKVLLLDPRSAAGYANLGVVYMRTNRFQDAAEAFTQAAALYGLGRVYLLNGEADEALTYLQQAAELKPDDDSIHFQLGQAYRKLGRKEEAQKEMTRVQERQAGEREMLERKVLGEEPPPPVQLVIPTQ